MKELDVLVGTWSLHPVFPHAMVVPEGGATTTFSWILDGAFLLQTTTIEHPDAPDAHLLYAPRAGGYLQHYFDSRGVVRLYEMTFDGTTWELLRTAADFSPLDFGQRFRATVSPDVIEGAWESAPAPGVWEHDFSLTYRRL